MLRRTQLIGLLLLGFAFMGASSCSTPLKYEADLNFTNSAQANSPEGLVLINDRECKNSQGFVGLCSVKVRSDRSIELKQPPKDYDYEFKLECSKGVTINPAPVHVIKGNEYGFVLGPEAFETKRAFFCRGSSVRLDNPNSISTFWEVRFLVYDGDYDARERMYYKDGHIVAGKHSKYLTVCEGEKCKFHHKKTVVKASKDSKAFSESEMGRMNYYGF